MATFRYPLWGNFVGFADSDLIAFAYLYVGGLRRAGYYHATQAIEKYLKALALAILDEDGTSQTALNNPWLETHDLRMLAAKCSKAFPYYAQPLIKGRLRKFAEFDQVARYPWAKQKRANGFTSEDLPAIWDLLLHLRSDLPIKVDDYELGMLVRGHYHGRPEEKLNAYHAAESLPSLIAIRILFPDIHKLVRL